MDRSMKCDTGSLKILTPGPGIPAALGSDRMKRKTPTGASVTGKRIKKKAGN